MHVHIGVFISRTSIYRVDICYNLPLLLIPWYDLALTSSGVGGLSPLGFVGDRVDAHDERRVV